MTDEYKDLLATVERRGRLYWLACYDNGEGMGICTEHLTRWGARRAARRWKKRQMTPICAETMP